MISPLLLHDTTKSVHFIGIGGAGMQSLAETLHAWGYVVTGSDLQHNDATKRLEKQGIPISFSQFKPVFNVLPNLVVHSSAIAKDNPELKTLTQLNIPILSRGKLLGILAENRYSIAVAGTHGKTSTVGLIAHIALQHALDPTVIGGGHYNNLQSNVHIGNSPYFITEADESDASLLFLRPNISVLTSISKDHLATYSHHFEKLLDTFRQFLTSDPFNSQSAQSSKSMVFCLDDPEIKKMMSTTQKKPFISYGIQADAMIKGIDISQVGEYLQFTALRNALNLPPLKLKVKLSGHYNVLNSLAAVAVGHILKIPDMTIQKAFETYQGVKRRFQILGTICVGDKRTTVIDDYGHHPREITATFQAVRSTWVNHRVLLIFQPHRYTRTQDLFEAFVTVLAEKPDIVILLPIYAAHEFSIANISSEGLVKAIRDKTSKPVLFAKNLCHLKNIIYSVLQPNDILLFQGAGDISQMAHDFVKDNTA